MGIGGGLMGFVGGFAGQLNQDYAQQQQTATNMYAKQQALVDKVAGEQSQVESQAKKVVQTKEALKGQYNIDDDLAYTLATDPSFDKMDPDKRADYIQRLKPTGKYTQQGQVSGGAPVPGSGYQTPGVLGFGSKTVPPVNSAVYPSADPNLQKELNAPRQIYSPEPPKPNYRSLYGVFPPPRDNAQAAAQAKLAQLDVPGASPDSIPPSLVAQAYGKDPKEAKSAAMSKTMDLLASGHIKNAADAETVYEGLGGHKKDFDWTTISAIAKDPVFEQKINTLTGIGVDPVIAKKIVVGAIHVTHDPVTGQAQAMDLTEGKLLDPQQMQILKNNNILPQSPPQPQQNNATSQPQGQPQQPGQQPPPTLGKGNTLPPTSPPQNVNTSSPQPTTNTGAQVQLPSQIVKPTPQPWVTKPVYDMVSKELSSVPQSLAKLHYATDLLEGNPNSVGMTGHALTAVGGPLVQLGNIISTKVGDIPNQWFNVSNTNQFKAAMEDLRASMPRPVTQDQTGGRISNYEREQIAGIFGNEDWHSSYQSVKANLGYVQNLMYRTIAGDLNAMYPAPQDLATNQQAQANRFSFLTKQLNLSSKDAYSIMATEIGAKQGQGLK